MVAVGPPTPTHKMSQLVPYIAKGSGFMANTAGLPCLRLLDSLPTALVNVLLEVLIEVANAGGPTCKYSTLLQKKVAMIPSSFIPLMQACANGLAVLQDLSPSSKPHPL